MQTTTGKKPCREPVGVLTGAWLALSASPSAHASLFSGDTLDAVANVLAWIVLFVAPAIAIGVFWIVHILPERIAEKRHHPQASAIKTLCLLSLFFGGLLWPLAWLWAYSKPVLYKIAYGEDKVVPAHETPETYDKVTTTQVVTEVEETIPGEHPVVEDASLRAKRTDARWVS